jgi:hypothetical protein
MVVTEMSKDMPANRFGPIQQMLYLIFRDVTPVRLRLLFVLNCLGALIFCALSLITIKQHEHAVQTIGYDATPSVIAAHQIKIAVEKMDTALVNELLYSPGQPEGQQMVSEFEKWRVVAGKELVNAAKNITYGEAEQVPIENIESALGKYELSAQRARDAHADSKGAEALEQYRMGLATIEKELLPNADALNKANADKLESIYGQEESRSALSAGLLIALAFALIALLLSTQAYLTKRFRRRLNLPLLISVVCTALLVRSLYGALRENASQLRLAKEDAYDSMTALLDACSSAYEANAAESRWLLDRGHAPEHEKLFRDKVASVANFSGKHNFAETVARAQDQLTHEAKFKLPGFEGSLADELNNIRFEGEGRAAVKALESFSEYCAADARMRQLENSGAHASAIRIGLGYSPNQSKWWFTKFDDALQLTLAINQDYFRRAVTNASRDLSGLITLSQALFLLTIVCIYLGLRDRMAEYM